MSEERNERNPETGGVVGHALRLNEQKQFEKRKKRRGPPPVVEGMSIQQRFERFHERNPFVADELEELALALLSKGIENYSISGLYETLRYRKTLKTTGTPFKLQNSFRSRYARLLMKRNPALKTFFKTRELTSL